MNFENLGLVLRFKTHDALPAHPNLIHADIDALAFETAWSRVPVYLRVLSFFAIYWTAFSRRFATRASLFKSMETTDTPSRAALLNWDDDIGFIDAALLHERDAKSYGLCSPHSKLMQIQLPLSLEQATWAQ